MLESIITNDLTKTAFSAWISLPNLLIIHDCISCHRNFTYVCTTINKAYDYYFVTIIIRSIIFLMLAKFTS